MMNIPTRPTGTHKELPQLFLGDFAGLDRLAVIAKTQADFCETLDPELDILIAYMEEGPWGCDSGAWFLLRNRATGGLFEASGSHCSCYGFETQWKPEATSAEYLKSEHCDVTRVSDYSVWHADVRAWVAANL